MSVRGVARAVLATATRRGGPWSRAVLADFDRTTGRWEAVRWAAGGLRTVWVERRSRVRTLVLATATLALAAMLLNAFVVSARYTPSGAMEPTLVIGDRWLVDKVGFRVTGLHRGDVVEFPMPGDESRLAVKRIIGLPGDVIDCRDGGIVRNGAALDEPYLLRVHPEDITECNPVTVPDGMFFAFGDHRVVSQDSRHWGPISLTAVEGRLLTTLG